MSKKSASIQRDTSPELWGRAGRIRLVLTDVDGVLTSSHLFYGV